MPFIRYDTGDIGTQIRSVNEDVSRHRLINLGGRVTDYIKIGGKIIGSPVLTVLMGKFDIHRYQILQTSQDEIELIIERGKTYTLDDEKYIRQSFLENIGEKTKILFNYKAEFINSENKHKFIIRKY
jgi:phenylacetate-CoA ligase